MNKYLFFLQILFLNVLNPTVSQAQKATISISNPSAGERKEEVVAIAWKEVLAKYPSIDTANFKVINVASKKEIPWQLEYKGGKAVQNLLVQVDIAAKGSVKLLLQKGKSANFPTKTYGRYVPERKEDFAWENDKIAFRMYGKELEQTPKEMAYGIDVWGKRTDKMVINERYKRGNYHEDIGDGLDYYHVGFTLGAGNMMPYINDSIYYSRNYVEYKMLDNGPLRTTFQLFYHEWKVGENKLSAVKTISLDAGSQLNSITVDYTTTSTKATPVVAGIITREGNGIKYLDEVNGTMVYWEPQHGNDGITGVACLFDTPIEKMTEANGQLLAKTVTDSAHSITYYAGAVWNKAGIITDGKQWIQYVDKFKQQLKNPLIVVIN